MLKSFAQAFAYLASNYASTPSPTAVGTNVTGGNSANGSSVAWGGGALGFEGQLLVVGWFGGGATSTDTRSLIDILIDPAGGTSWSSTPLVTGLLAGFGAGVTGGTGRRIALPLRIPSGANLGMQARSLTTGRTHSVIMQVFGGYKQPGDWRCGSRCISLGVDEANYNGTLVTPGNSGAWGASWTSIGSAITTNLFGLNLVYGGPNGNTTSTHGMYFQLGADSQPLGMPADTNDPHLYVATTTGELAVHHRAEMIAADVPDGTQLQARGKHSTTGAAASGIAIYAVTG